ncbi:hypothetical protein BH23PLA1_BH23PLA1_00910 [soil metagenome]
MKDPQSRRGFALPLAVVYASIVLGAWCVANRQTAALLRLKECQERRERAQIDDNCRRLALAHALALLESGTPSLEGEDPVYWLTIRDFEGVDRVYILEFLWVEADQWAIEVRSDSDPGAAPIAELPGSF